MYTRLCQSLPAVVDELPDHIRCFKRIARLFLALGNVAFKNLVPRRPMRPMPLQKMLLVEPLNKSQGRIALRLLESCVQRMQQEFDSWINPAKERKRRSRGRPKGRRLGKHKLYDDWKAAKAAGTKKVEDFARDRRLEVHAVRAALESERKYRERERRTK